MNPPGPDGVVFPKAFGDREQGTRARMAERDGDDVLRAKYRDYCSARVADAVLSLDPEEIYSLAENEARLVKGVAPASYNDAIRYATARIREQLDLPEFDDWARQYRERPGRFDPYLLGLWKSEEEEE